MVLIKLYTVQERNMSEENTIETTETEAQDSNASIEVDTSPEVESDVSEQKVDDDVLKKAKSYGYIEPKDYNGGKTGGAVLTPEEFIERTENNLNISKAQLEKQNKKIQELTESITYVRDYAKKSEERGYKKALADAAERKQQAFDDMDDDAFKKADAEEKELEAK